MVHNPPEGQQRIIPYLFYDDVHAAVEFLTTAFGFRQRMVHEDPDDPEHIHAEVSLGDAVLMMGRASRRWGTAAARTLPALHCAIYVYVDDVDAHFRQAQAAGARIESEPRNQPYGHRSYTARDLEGNQWHFAMPLE